MTTKGFVCVLVFTQILSCFVQLGWQDSRDGNHDLEPLYNKEMNQKTTEYIIVIPHKVLHGRAQTTAVTNHCVAPGSLLLVGSSATQLLSRVKATVK